MPSIFFRTLAKTNTSILSPELVLLQHITQTTLAVSDCVIADAECFSQLTEANQLFDDNSVSRLRDEASLTKLSKKIAKSSLPKTLSQELHREYHQVLGAGYVRIQCWSSYGSTPWISEVKGDANIAESLLTAWATMVELNFHRGASLLDAVTNCHAIIQAQPASPVASGEIFTRHPETGERHLIMIHLWPGAPHSGTQKETPTRYAIDIRTGMIVQRQVGSSNNRATRKPDGFTFSSQSESAEFHDDAEIVQIISQIASFKRKFPQNLHATFEVESDKLLITFVEPQTEEIDRKRGHIKLLTKVYVATGSSDELDITAHEESDGIGLLRSEYVFSRLGTHPLSIRKNGKSSVITEKIASFLNEANHSYPDRRIVYRLQNFTSQEMRAFKSGESQEKDEPNPYLGWRGGLRLIEQPELFEPELETFSKWLKQRHGPTGLMVPFVRSTAEWRWIINRWKERHFFDHPEFENWFQITTPENVSNLESYLLAGVHGLSLNIRTVTALMTGIDPDDQELQASYPPHIELQQAILSEVSQRVQLLKKQASLSSLKLHLHLEDFNNALVSSAVKLGYDGIVLHPAALLIGRSCVGVAEKDNLIQLTPTI
ncbi:hypothetical protein KA012_02130 [Candidatus Woesebacteria bacterium]|nr:hypothetical protein [Candidatus Woesebacteria bacterium]